MVGVSVFKVVMQLTIHCCFFTHVSSFRRKHFCTDIFSKKLDLLFSLKPYTKIQQKSLFFQRRGICLFVSLVISWFSMYYFRFLFTFSKQVSLRLIIMNEFTKTIKFSVSFPHLPWLLWEKLKGFITFMKFSVY